MQVNQRALGLPEEYESEGFNYSSQEQQWKNFFEVPTVVAMQGKLTEVS
jgi:hypothetical protein